jgi:hypothetical protein
MVVLLFVNKKFLGCHTKISIFLKIDISNSRFSFIVSRNKSLVKRAIELFCLVFCWMSKNMSGFEAEDEFYGDEWNNQDVPSQSNQVANQKGRKQHQLDEDLFDVFEDDQEEDYLTRTTVKTKNEMEKAGYRAGAIKAEEESTQKGFDDGFELGMKVGKVVGAFLASLVQYPTEDAGLKTTLYKVLASLVREGSQNRFSDEYFKSLDSTITSLPNDLQESFRSFRLSLKEFEMENPGK